MRKIKELIFKNFVSTNSPKLFIILYLSTHHFKFLLARYLFSLWPGIFWPGIFLTLIDVLGLYSWPVILNLSFIIQLPFIIKLHKYINAAYHHPLNLYITFYSLNASLNASFILTSLQIVNVHQANATFNSIDLFQGEIITF